jgi:hypothetical protein
VNSFDRLVKYPCQIETPAIANVDPQTMISSQIDHGGRWPVGL